MCKKGPRSLPQLAPSGGSRQRSMMPAIEVEADGRQTRPAQPGLTLKRHWR
jgi:hypothetical protein